jgi:hypothetical protein
MPLAAIQGLRAAGIELDEVGTRLQQLAKEKPEGWKKEYVGLRRLLHLHMDVAAERGEAVFRTGAAQDHAPAFREALRKMRHALALHQANWPVIAISPDNPDYRASMFDVIRAHQDLNRIIKQIAAVS